MKAGLIVVASSVLGLALAFVGAISNAQQASNSQPSGSAANEPSGQTNKLPAKVPEPEKWEFITNPGVSAAVTRFFRLIQDDSIKVDGALAAPFLMRRDLLADMGEVAAFVEKARTGAPKDEKSHTILGMKMLPPGNTFDEAKRWFGLGEVSGKEKQILEHAAKHKAWLVRVDMATRDGSLEPREIWFAVTGAETEDKARVVGTTG